MRLILLLLAGLPLVLSAQPGEGLRPWWQGPLIDVVNLTDAQRTQIQATTREFRNRLVDARAAVEKAEGELDDIFNDAKVDERRGNDAIDRLARARGDLTKVISQMSLRLRVVLTTEQWQELRRRGRGPGLGLGPGLGRVGPGGPGPGPLRGGPEGRPGGGFRGKNRPGGPNQGRPGGPGGPQNQPPPNVAPPKPAVL